MVVNRHRLPVAPRVRTTVAAAATAVAVLVPFAIGGRRGFGLGITTAITLLLALGLQVTYGFSGQLNVAVAPIQGVGAFTVARLMTEHGWSFWACLPSAVLAAAAVGAVVGLPGLRVRGDVLALATLAAGEILQSLYLNTSWLSGGPEGIAAIPRATLLGSPLRDRGLYLAALAVTAVALAATVAVRRSPLGRAWVALRDDDLAAQSLGVSSARLRLLAFAVGAGFAGAAGALYAVQVQFVSWVSFGLEETVTVILVVLVAGEGRVWRTVAAAVGATALVDRLTGYGDVAEAVTGLVILLVVAGRAGFLGAARRRITAWVRARATMSAATEAGR